MATWSTTRCDLMFDRTQTLPAASPPTAMRLAVSSAGVVLINELISVDPHGRAIT